MKKTIELCDLCGSDITGKWDGILELRVRERWSDLDGPGRSRRTILICPYCKEQIKRMFTEMV